ncbi:uncharacterized protein LOC134264038 [Saccostrea cucullata]|uniref:uncharacterized protein LOC134264038 n=1 Tax=Saccostrea cuccullata TaxID=36930 RepID=UPI002ED55395
MVRSCVVYKCHNKADAGSKEKGVSFFRFPKDKRKRKAWVKAIQRDKWTPTEASYVCSAHFQGGWHSDDPGDINFRPTIFSYKEKIPNEREKARNQRLDRRNIIQEMAEAENTSKKILQKHQAFSLMVNDYCLPPTAEGDNKSNDNISNDINLDDTDIKSFSDQGVQTDPDPVHLECEQLAQELNKCSKDLTNARWNTEKIKDNDAKTKFYTGLPTYAVFLWLFNFLKPKAERMVYWTGPSKTAGNQERTRASTGSLKLIDQLFAVLARLRLGLFTQDIANRVGVSVGTYSKYFTTWICLLHAELKILNHFPSRDIVDLTMPTIFKRKYPSVRVILDCTEIFVQRSSSLVNQNATFSNYKHHTTFKFLIGITPSGVISFVSEGWGRVPDKQITIKSCKGFTIREALLERKCHLNIPPFMGSSAQFSTDQVFETQEIAELRIHVERSIGRVKIFHIFDRVLPLSLAPLATKLFKVACWLSNFDVQIVPK